MENRKTIEKNLKVRVGFFIVAFINFKIKKINVRVW